MFSFFKKKKFASQKQSALASLPLELLEIITDYLNLAGVARLNQTCKKLQYLYQRKTYTYIFEPRLYYFGTPNLIGTKEQIALTRKKFRELEDIRITYPNARHYDLIREQSFAFPPLFFFTCLALFALEMIMLPYIYKIILNTIPSTLPAYETYLPCQLVNFYLSLVCLGLFSICEYFGPEILDKQMQDILDHPEKCYR